MAYQGRKGTSQSSLDGLEEDFDVICTSCSFENKRTKAKTYCLNCNENLCDSCIKVHSKISALCDHFFQRELRSSQSNTTNTGTQQPESDALTEICPKHPEEIIQLYCYTHSALECFVCDPLEHTNCKDVANIRDVSSGIAKSDEVKTVLAVLRQIAALLRDSKCRTQNNKKKIAERYSKALDEIEGFKEEIVKHLNKLVDDLRKNASDLHDTAIKASEDQNAACEELLQNTEKITSELDTRRSKGQDNGLFVAVKRTKAMLSGLSRDAEQISNTTRSPRFVFERDDKLNGIVSSCNNLGTLEVTSKPRDVKYLYDIQASSDTNLKNCMITGIAVLPDNRLVINDSKHKTVSVIRSEKGINEIKSITMPSVPIDLAVFKDDKVAVTLKDQRYIQVLSLMPNLSKHDTIKVQRLNAGIAYIPDVFLLSPQSSEQDKTIHISDTTGSLLKTIKTTLVDPWYIAAIPDQSVIYVGDREGNSLDCKSMNGMRINTFTAKGIKEPRGITIDDDGFVYVCSSANNVVYQLPPTGLNSKKGGTEIAVDCPTAIAYDQGRLYISSASKEPTLANIIKVFEVV